MAPRGASAAPPSRPGQDAAAPSSGGAGPGLGPEAPTPTCARILRMTAGSCRVAIRRSRPPQWGHARTSMANARCIRAAQVQARGVGFTPASCGPAASGSAVLPVGSVRGSCSVRVSRQQQPRLPGHQVTLDVTGRLRSPGVSPTHREPGLDWAREDEHRSTQQGSVSLSPRLRRRCLRSAQGEDGGYP